MFGTTNVGGTASDFKLKDAIIQIKSAVGSTISFFDEENNLIKLLSPSMGIIDNDNIGLANYYCAIPSKFFGVITIKLNYDNINTYKLEVNITSNKFYYYNNSDFNIIMPNILKLFENGYFSNMINGVQILNGTGSTQSDTLIISNMALEYCEWNNDYGGLVTQTACSFAGYNTLRINIDDISSWQSDSFKAAVYLSTSKPTSVTASGITTYNYREDINPTGNSDLHIKNYGKEIIIPLEYYQGTYYIIITTASGQSVNITPGRIRISVMQLEKSNS